MKTFIKSIILLLPLFALLIIYPLQVTVLQTALSPTPTYDPLVEPPLPENPSELELGRNLYWHWCMPCHGDRGQGLTDEFRAIWEPDHQNCWDRGCHGGQGLDEGFPIPTIVPGIVNETNLAHFAVVQELSGYLGKTHPPQSPGILESEEYHAIALFVFTMNGRSLSDISVTDTPVPVVTSKPAYSQVPPSRSYPVIGIIVAVLLVGAIILVVKKSSFNPNNP